MALLQVSDPASIPSWRAPSTHGLDRRWYRLSLAPAEHTNVKNTKMKDDILLLSEETSPLPPLQSTPQMELGSILLGVQNREPKMKKGTQIDIVHNCPPSTSLATSMQSS